MECTFPLKKVHIVGIGGVGVSAIAELLLSLGVQVQGSDIQESANTRRLEVKGIKIFIGQKGENITGVDAVVASTAVPEDNPELVAARAQKIPVGRRAEILAEILRYKQGICVSGSHGKTTTSSLITHILKESGLAPSCIVGGILTSTQSNALCDKGPYLVVEADESDGTFLQLPTTISVVTNINPEHIVYHYGTYENYKQAFRLFVQNTAFYGYSVLCIDHPEVKKIYDTVKDRRLISYGLDANAAISAKNIRLTPQGGCFDMVINTDDCHTTVPVFLPLLGTHNIQNALGATGAALMAGVPVEKIVSALGTFMGVQRRLTQRGKVNDVVIYDDYAVHPVEINTTLKAIKDITTSGKIVAVFQPHRYTRMADVWDEFHRAFSCADTVIVADIYAVGEKPIAGFTHDAMIAGIKKYHKNVYKLNALIDLADMIKAHTKAGDTVICLGAGTISAACREAVQTLTGQTW